MADQTSKVPGGLTKIDISREALLYNRPDEIVVLGQCVDRLNLLDEAARRRVVDYLWARYGGKTECGS